MGDPRMNELYRARRAALEAEAAVLDEEDEGLLVARLVDEIATAEAQEPTERSFRLQILADLLSKVSDRRAIHSLVLLLGDPDASVRAYVVDRLERVLRAGRGPEVLWAVENSFAELTGPGLSQVPALLMAYAQIEEQPPIDLLVRILDHEDPEAVAEAACALAAIEMPAIQELLSSFEDDERPLATREEGDPATVGALVRELLEVAELDAALLPRA